MLEISLDDYLQRFKAFDSLPPTIRNQILDDPEICPRDWILELGISNFVLSIGELATQLSACQSPIEMKMYLALDKVRYLHNILDIQLQQEIICGDKKYRADFVVLYGDPIKPEYKEIVVECDGHDFHEKTKAQAARDKKRDRDMQIAGYQVLRFTGSEIYRNAAACVAEVVSLVNKGMGR